MEEPGTIAEWLAVAAEYVAGVDAESAWLWQAEAESLAGGAIPDALPSIILAHAGGPAAYAARLRPVEWDTVAAG